ncbi:MAG: hypothetical protein ABI355_14990, partial [Solirubrobacteraceae bacterium]
MPDTPTPPRPHPSRNGHQQRPKGRARQRALMIAAVPAGEDEHLDELRELLRTAGVAAAGEMVQRRETPHPNT